jgi:DNA primase
MAWVSFEEIKKAVSLEMVIRHYGFELRRINATSLRGKCPLPMHGSDTSRSSFTATFTKGVGGVWACQSRSCVSAREGKKGGNALDLVAIMERCSIRDAAMKLQEWFRVETSQQAPEANVPRSEKPAPLVSKEEAGTPGEGNKPLTFTLQGIDPDHPYLSQRGISPETARRFGVGFFRGNGSMKGRVVIPIHDETGRLVAYAGRAIDGSEPKYKLPTGFQKSRELYNLHRAKESDRVILVEGFFGCIKLAQAGLPALALMGCTMSKEQEELLVSHFDAVWLMLDPDEAGRHALTDLVSRLSRRIWVKAFVLDDVQPDALSFDQVNQLLSLW